MGYEEWKGKGERGMKDMKSKRRNVKYKEERQVKEKRQVKGGKVGQYSNETFILLVKLALGVIKIVS